MHQLLLDLFETVSYFIVSLVHRYKIVKLPNSNKNTMQHYDVTFLSWTMPFTYEEIRFIEFLRQEKWWGAWTGTWLTMLHGGTLLGGLCSSVYCILIFNLDDLTCWDNLDQQIIYWSVAWYTKAVVRMNRWTHWTVVLTFWFTRHCAVM